VKDRPGHDLRYAMDTTKMKKEFGWEPKISFDEGIAKTVEWYLINKQWWEEIISGEYKEYYVRMYGKREQI
jgi:dTDP-glucose 4,6-dehydratase